MNLATTRLTPGLLGALLCLCWLVAAAPVVAGNVYAFKDAQGNLLLTNVVSASKQPIDARFRRFDRLAKITWYAGTHGRNNPGAGAGNSLDKEFGRSSGVFDNIIEREATGNGIDRRLIKAVIHTESGFNPAALSRPGAQGLMQLMPATAARYNVLNPFDPAENIRAGARHLKYLLDRYQNLRLALAAYNAGEANVEKYGGIPPFAETQDYVRQVISRYASLYGGSL